MGLVYFRTEIYKDFDIYSTVRKMAAEKTTLYLLYCILFDCHLAHMLQILFISIILNYDGTLKDIKSYIEYDYYIGNLKINYITYIYKLP